MSPLAELNAVPPPILRAQLLAREDAQQPKGKKLTGVLCKDSFPK